MDNAKNILSHEQTDLIDDLAKTSRAVVQAKGELEILLAKKLTVGEEVEIEVRARVKKVLELSKDALLQIQANGRAIASIKNNANDLFNKIIEFADRVIEADKTFETYRVNALKALDELANQLVDKESELNYGKKLVAEQWEDIGTVRKDLAEKEKLLNSRTAALQSAIAEMGYKEADIDRRIKKKGKTK